jgi:hypothetical protein
MKYVLVEGDEWFKHYECSLLVVYVHGNLIQMMLLNECREYRYWEKGVCRQERQKT